MDSLTAELRSSGLEFYSGLQTWLVPVVQVRQPGLGNWLASLGRNVIELRSVRGFYSSDLTIGWDIAAPKLVGRSAFSYNSLQRFAKFEITAIVGLAELSPLTAGPVSDPEVLDQGDSIIRNDAEVIVPEPVTSLAPYTVMDGDMLARRPAGITSAVLGIAKRIMYEEQMRVTGKEARDRRFEENWQNTLRQYQVVRLV